MRELADWDPDRYDRIARWPLREALLAFEQRLKRIAREDYQHELFRHAVQAPWFEDKRDRQPPEPPPILRD